MQFKCLFFTIAFLLNFLPISFAQEPTLLDHGGGVRTVEYSPLNASLVASAGESNVIKLWNLQNDTVQTLRGHTGIVNSIAFSPNGELLASVSHDRAIKLWNVHNQQNIATLREGTLFRSVAFSPNGQLLATGGGMHVKLWDVGRRAEIATLLHDKWVETVAFSDDGQFLAAGDRWKDGSGTVKVWDVKSRQVVATLEKDMVVVRSVTFSSDNQYLASSHYNGEVKVWNVSDWQLLRAMPAGDYDIAFSPDGKMIVGTRDRYVNLWWVEDGTKVAELPGPTGWQHPVDFSHDGISLAVGGEDGFVRLYNIEDIKEDIEIRSRAAQQPEIVRLIYFLPNDRPARPDRVTALRQLVKDAQQFFADEMKRHGHGKKTFEFETDATTGKILVHHVNGRFGDQYYYTQTTAKVWKEIKEIDEPFYHPKHIYLFAIDIGSEVLASESIEDNWCGEGSVIWEGGGQEIIIPASGHCFNVGLVAHELGHAFGLAHDFRDDAHVMSYSALRNELSSCAAEWLNKSRFFNVAQSPSNIPFQIDKDTTVKMLPPIEVPPNGVRLRFEINDSDGLHQAQLYIPTTDRDPVEGSGFKLHSCRSLSGEVSTLEFIITELPEEDAFVRLRVMDIRGNFKWWKHYFPIQATDILRKSASLVGAVDATGTVPETLWKISGDQQHGLLNNRLANPFVVAVRDADNEPVAGVQVTFQVTVGGGRLSITNPWTDSNGHAQTFLTLGNSQVSRVEVSVSGISERVIFSTDSQPQVLIAESQRPPMYWVDAGPLYRLAGAEVENLVPSVQNATSLAVDVADEKLYWVERTSDRTGRIRRANFDGTNVQLVKDLTSVPYSIAIDAANDKLYLTNSWGKIQRINFDGSGFEPNLIIGLDAPKHLTLDMAGGKFYWTERTNRIRHANLDGSNIQTLFTDLGTVGGIAIANDKLYWTEQTGESVGNVQSANLDGNPNVRTLTSLRSVPLGITVDPMNRKLYWTSSGGTIQRANLDGSPNVQILVVGLGTPAGIVVSTARADVNAVSSDAVETIDVADINADGTVNKTDLLLLLTALGENPPTNSRTDVNGDGTVNVADLLLVIENLNDPVNAAAPSSKNTTTSLDPVMLTRYLNTLHAESDGSHKYQQAIAFLQGLLAVTLPDKTQLLANYPNPFNPETWIPYQLSEPAEVTLTIYTVNGNIVRKLVLGHQPAGMYHSKSLAAYWDGRNEQEERVASGVYLYTLSAGDFTATRKMFIRK